MTDPGATMLELARLNTFRGPAQILRDVSLRVGAGEAVCLVGRNGAGKTTTIDSIMGLLPVRSGRIAFRQRDITRVPTHRRVSSPASSPAGSHASKSSRRHARWRSRCWTSLR